MKEERRKGAGGKLNRSEILQARLDPRLRLAAEILSRDQRRTLSSLIEMLIEQATERCTVSAMQSTSAQINRYLFGNLKTRKVKVKDIVDVIWSSEEADRFALFALYLPHLLTTEEEAIWSVIVNSRYFWEHFDMRVENKSGKLLGHEPFPIVNYRGLIKEHLQEYWPLLNAVMHGKEKPEKLFALKQLPPGRKTKQPEDYPLNFKKVSPI